MIYHEMMMPPSDVYDDAAASAAAQDAAYAAAMLVTARHCVVYTRYAAMPRALLPRRQAPLRRATKDIRYA